MKVDSALQSAHRILAHYDVHARALPWRNPPGRPLPTGDPDWPYRVWLSEIMLQQTTVAAVKPYFAKFTERWPNVAALAAAEDAEVMSAWAGLGYYARARNLLACARLVAAGGGHFPDEEAMLRTLPGIGAYTAAAIAAIAFGRRAVVIDGNIERVTARLFAEPDKAALPALVEAMTPERAGDFAQAMMDLGATICTPRQPACAICPVADMCHGRLDPQAYPAKTLKVAKPHRRGTAWWIERGGQVALIERPAKGLLGGMRALPSDAWDRPRRPREGEGLWVQLNSQSGPRRREGDVVGQISHVFTHFAITLEVRALDADAAHALAIEPIWWPVDRIEEAGLPTVFLKAARLAAARGESEC